MTKNMNLIIPGQKVIRQIFPQITIKRVSRVCVSPEVKASNIIIKNVPKSRTIISELIRIIERNVKVELAPDQRNALIPAHKNTINIFRHGHL